MAIFNKHESCFGITIFRWKQKRVEIWICASGYEIKPHRHPEENVELVFLFGQTTFYRQSIKTMVEESVKTTWRMIGKKFTVEDHHYHWFRVGKLPLVFINFQTFHDGCKPKSAAKDFLCQI